MDNNILGIVRSGNTIYVAGAFTHAGPNTGCGVPIDVATGRAQPVFSRVAGVVNAAIADGSGGWFIGGALVGVGGLPRSGVAHISASGQVDDWNPGCDGRVLSLALKGNTLYVGGEFSRIGGEARANMAALSATTGRTTDWNPGADRSVMAFIVGDSTLFAGGSFGLSGGQLRNGLVELNLGTGLATAWNPVVGGVVQALAKVDDILYLGGQFISVGGQRRQNVAAVDIRTAQLTTWNPSATSCNCNSYDGSPYVSELVAGETTIYVAGHFSIIGGQDRGGLAEVDLLTGAPTAWDPEQGPRFQDYAPFVTSLALTDSTVYVGGPFYTIGGQDRYFVAEIDRRTAAATAWDPRADGAPEALAVSGNVVYAGGLFHTMGEWQRRRNLAAFEATTGKLLPWNPNPDGVVVYDLAVHGNRVYVGGHFWTIGGQPRGAIAALDPITGAALEWTADMDGLPKVLKVAGNRLYIGGSFTSIGGIRRNHAASFDLETGGLTDWDPSPDRGDVEDLEVSGEIVYLCGSFHRVGGIAREYLASVHATTGQVMNWDPKPDLWVLALAARGSTVFAGGAFRNIGGRPRNRLAAIDATTGEAIDWVADAVHANPNFVRVYALELAGDDLYVGGSFHSIAGESRSGLAAVNAGTGALMPWNPSPGAPTTDYPLQPAVIWDLTAHGNTLYVGGRFRYVGTAPATTLAGISMKPGQDEPGRSPQRLALAPMIPNPMQSSAVVRFDLPAGGPVSLAVFDIKGRRVASLLDHVAWPAGTYEIPLLADGWPPGFYFCRLEAGGVRATQKFVLLK